MSPLFIGKKMSRSLLKATRLGREGWAQPPALSFLASFAVSPLPLLLRFSGWWPSPSLGGFLEGTC